MTEIENPKTKKVLGLKLKPNDMDYQINLLCNKDKFTLEPT